MVKPRSILVFVVVLAALLGFLWLFGRAIYLTMTHAEAPVFGDTYGHVANILSGLVGGIVAVGFGQSPPPAPAEDLNILSRNAVGLGSFITAGSPPGEAVAPSSRAREVIGLIYATVYVVLGLGAIVVWVADDKPPELVKNLATVSAGLFLPIITAFFKETEA